MIFDFDEDRITISDDMMMHRVVIQNEMFIKELAVTINDDVDSMNDLDESYSYTVGNVEVNVTEKSIELTDLTADAYNHITVDDEEDLTQLPNLFNMVVAQLEYSSPFDMEISDEPEISQNA